MTSKQDADSLAAYERWFALNGHSRNTWLAWQAAVDFMTQEFARRGGRVTSDAKRTAARENGRKGGRPRKET